MVFQKNFKNVFLKKLFLFIIDYKFVSFLFFVANAVMTIIKICNRSPGTYKIYYESAKVLQVSGNLYHKVEYDYFLYSPTFAFLMTPFTYIPYYLGAFIFNMFGVGLLILAINMLKIESWRKSVIYVMILFETINSVNCFQLNVLVAALCVLTFVFLERRKLFLSAFMVALGLFTKIFGVGFAVLFLFYKEKRKYLIYVIICIFILLLLPLIYSGFDFTYYKQLYANWFAAYNLRHIKPEDTSLLGCLNFYFNTKFQSIINPICICSIIILALPLLRSSQYENYNFRLLFLSTLLIWVVIFNPAAEGRTYTIAVVGIAFWFVVQKPSWLSIITAFLAIVFSSLIWTDLCPASIRDIIFPEPVKVMAPTAIWIIAEMQLLFKKFQRK